MDNTTSFSQDFNTTKLLRFAMPSIIMMMIMSSYTIIDGMFVSRYVGSNALAAINIVYPFMSIAIGIGTMLSTGGNAIISIYLGQGEKKKARKSLTMFVVIALIISVVLMTIGFCFLTPICRLLGATDVLLHDCQTYLKIIMLFTPACMLQILFQSFLVTAERSKLGLILIIGAGVLNISLDYIFIAQMQLGVSGAAYATGIGQLLPAVIGFIYFSFSKRELHFSKFSIKPKIILEACYNGSSEMIGQLSNGIITFFFNIILIRLAGTAGVAAITIILYGQFLFNAFFTGFSMGISPIIGFKYGANDRKSLRIIYKSSIIFVIITSIILALVSFIFAVPLVSIFTQDVETQTLAITGFKIFTINFIFSGFNIISSGMFTALSNGKVSAIISFSRTLVFLIISLFTLSWLFGVTGVWFSVPVAEFSTLLLSIYMHRKYLFKNGLLSSV